MTKHKIPILSFFSGGGFLDIGFEMAGFDIIWTNEIDQDFTKLHSAGITSWRKSRGNGVKAEIFNTKSIAEINTKDIVAEAFLSAKPNHFGIIGGPPCQDFSSRGNKKGFNGDLGKLTESFFNKINDLMPTFFVMENVPGLLRINSHKEYLAAIVSKISGKYSIKYQILNALNYGVPQSRERVFIIGINKSHINNFDEKSLIFPVSEKYVDALTKFNWPEAVKYGKELKKPDAIPIELCVENCLVPAFKRNIVSNADEYFQLHIGIANLKRIKEGETNRPSFKRLHRFKYSPTACYGNNEVHLHPYENRRISVREALRIQGVPDSYILPSEISLTKKFKMIGNGVPVPLAHAVAKSIKNFLNIHLNTKI